MIFNGLTDKQAEKSRAQFGENKLPKAPAPSFKMVLRKYLGSIYFKIFLSSFLAAEAIILLREITYDEAYNVFSLVLLLFGHFAAGAAAVIVSAATEYISLCAERKSVKAEKINTCRVYRCGNTVCELAADKIVKDDYVLLQTGDIVPADGKIVWGDITVLKDNGEKLVRHNSDEANVYNGSPVTSGNAVMKVTAVGAAAKKITFQKKQDKTYKLVCIIGYAAATIGFAAYMLFRASKLDGVATPLSAAVLACGLFNSAAVMMMFCGRIKNPNEFFGILNLDDMKKNKIYPHNFAEGADILFLDKSSFLTDGNPTVAAFVDGAGASYAKHSDIPYPLGTLIAAAITETTPALSNRGSFFCSTVWKRAELEFISGRIKRKSELECEAADISDIDKISWSEFISGTPNEILPKCKLYYDNTGVPAEITNHPALVALSDELYYQGNRVVAFADKDKDGSLILVGFLTIREKLRPDSSAAFRAMVRNGVAIVLLSDDSISSAVSISDKSITGATAREIASAEKIASMSDRELAEFLPSLRVISGKTDRARLIRVAKARHWKAAITALTYDDIEASSEADIIYASDKSCDAARQAADTVVYGGIAVLNRADEISKSTGRKAAFYTVAQFILSVAAAVVTLFVTASGKADIIGGFVLLASIVVNTLIPLFSGNGTKKTNERQF